MSQAPATVRSMTGFGRGAAEEDGLRVEVEVKGVNHRFLDVRLRLPAEFADLEGDLRARVQRSVARGRVDVAVTLIARRAPVFRAEVRSEMIAEYLRAAGDLKKQFRLRGALSLDQVMALPGAVLVSPGPAVPVGAGAGALNEAFDSALAGYQTMRAAEGARLDADVRARLAEIDALLNRMRDEARRLPRAYAERLKARLDSLAVERGLDEVRLAQEVALLADRVDITEELVRLEGYLTQASAVLEHPGGPAGKTLDFVMQEMNREATTISSKAESLPICQAALAVRGAVEKIREQVQNIE